MTHIVAIPARLTPRKPMRLAAFLLAALSALSLGCGKNGGGMSLISITPVLPSGATSTTATIDAGQALPIQVSVVNDSTHAGASISLSGLGTLGQQTVTTLSDSEQIAITYTAPAVAATSTVIATANNTPSQTALLAITTVPALAITPATLPAGTTGAAYSQTLASTGGAGLVKFALASGTLPAGFALSGATLAGNPTTAGTYTFAIAATDSATLPFTVTQSYTLTINAQAPVVTTSSLPNGIAGTAYSQQLTYAGGGSGTPTFAITTGTLPPGLTLSPAGLISGTPTTAAAGNSYAFSVNVTVGTQTSPAVALSITLPVLPIVATTTLPSANVGIAYKQQLAYTGGNGAAPVWAVSAGTLPAGLALSASGLLAGTPTTAASSTFSVTVTVGPQTSAPQSLMLVVNNLNVSSSANAFGEVGLPFSFQLTAQGGLQPYKWVLAQGSAALPAGLTLNGATGLISGAPTTATSTPLTGITVMVTDSATPANTATQAMTFSIATARSNVNNAQLKGTYAFLLQGFDAAGRPLTTAGNFTADGLGNLLSGTVDVNGTGQATAMTAAALTPTTYTVGADERGQLILTFGSSTADFTLALNGITGGIASGGYLTEFDATGQTRTGVLTQAFTTASLTGGYAFGLDGFASASTAALPVHRAGIGELQLSNTGTATSSELLLSSGGTGNPLVPTSATVSVAASGRGTLAITLPNSLGTLNFAIYVVSPAEFFLISTDPAANANAHDLLAGAAYQQTVTNGSFTASSLNATSVARLERLNLSTTGAYLPDVTVGLLAFNGVGGLTLTGDENAGGVATKNSSTGTYTVAANGRVTASLATVSGIGGCTDCASLSTYFYLIGANRGFVMDFSAPVTTGYFEPQTATTLPATGPGTAANSSAGTLDPLSPASTDASGVVQPVITPNGLLITLTTDQNTAGTLAPDQTISANATPASSGRIALTSTSSSSPVLYVISPTKDLELDLSAGKPVAVEVLHQ